jgi:hypothetical protein
VAIEPIELKTPSEFNINLPCEMPHAHRLMNELIGRRGMYPRNA